ncbi:hypothetical protein M9H77_26176 [Catharanthus roseus]|uniref:Uncharacterized protein n=1 Tax=Catharanthus roseus TaxID=4058 RepID=A0ACC0AD69_CATRO|nr:hypothetical protein M9H77_26176 [Catharanthus roseus]
MASPPYESLFRTTCLVRLLLIWIQLIEGVVPLEGSAQGGITFDSVSCSVVGANFLASWVRRGSPARVAQGGLMTRSPDPASAERHAIIMDHRRLGNAFAHFTKSSTHQPKYEKAGQFVDHHSNEFWARKTQEHRKN